MEVPMNAKLNIKQWALASIAVFVIITAVTFIMIKLGVQPWVMPAPQGEIGTKPDILTSRLATYLSRLILSGIFTYIFTKTNYKDQSGIGHGLRFGFGIGLLMYIPNFISLLAFSDLSTAALVSFMVVGVIQSVVCGAAMAYVYKPGKTVAD
jgi:hypothetical protein